MYIILATCTVVSNLALETMSKILSYTPSTILSLVYVLNAIVNILSLNNTNIRAIYLCKNREEFLSIIKERISFSVQKVWLSYY